MILSKNGELCDENGLMRMEDFQYAMRQQIKFYAQRKLTDCLVHENLTEAKLAQVQNLSLTYDKYLCFDMKNLKVHSLLTVVLP
jgi:hypothetical protein